MKRWGLWLTGAALVAAAWGATLLAPAPTAWRTPFTTRMTVGEVQTSGNFTATVHEVYFANELTDSQPTGIWTGIGNFLVLDISAQVRNDESLNVFVTRTATLNGNEYWPTERVYTQLSAAQLSVAMSARGTIVYELPPDVRSGTMQVQLGMGDAKQAGQVLRLEIQLDDVAERDSVTLEKVRWEPAL